MGDKKISVTILSFISKNSKLNFTRIDLQIYNLQIYNFEESQIYKNWMQQCTNMYKFELFGSNWFVWI